MKKRLLTLIFTLFVGTFSVFAQMSDPTSWTFSQKKTGDNEYALTFKATIQPGVDGLLHVNPGRWSHAYINYH